MYEFRVLWKTTIVQVRGCQGEIALLRAQHNLSQMSRKVDGIPVLEALDLTLDLAHREIRVLCHRGAQGAWKVSA